MGPHAHEPRKSFWKTPPGWAFLGFAAVAAFFLAVEHTAHVFGALPWLLLGGCLVMHLFGHGHGGHGRDDGHGRADGRGRDAAGPFRDDPMARHHAKEPER